MKVSELLPGSKVDIRIVQLASRQNEVESDESVYYSTVFDVDDHNRIEVNMPIIAGKLQLLRKNIRYEFIFTTNSGLYKAQGTVVEHLKKENFYLLQIQLADELEKFQRREYFRLDCMIPLLFMGLTEEAVKQDSIVKVKNFMDTVDGFKVRGIGTMLDISGGGTRFVSSNSLKDIPYILLQFQLECQEEVKEIDVVGKVIASDKAKDGDKYVHRVKFYFKDNQNKEKVISYIFEEERRLRKKEQGI